MSLGLFTACQGKYKDKRSGTEAEIYGRVWKCKGTSWKLKAKTESSLQIADFSAGPANGAELRVSKGDPAHSNTHLPLTGAVPQVPTVRWTP